MHYRRATDSLTELLDAVALTKNGKIDLPLPFDDAVENNVIETGRVLRIDPDVIKIYGDVLTSLQEVDVP